MSTLINGRNGYPSIFSFSSNGSSGTFTDMAGILTIVPPPHTKGTIDMSNHGTTDGYDQCIPQGITRTGQISFTAIYLSTNAQHNSLVKEAMDNGTRIGWKITMAGTSSNNTLYGDGFMTEWTPTVPFEDKIIFAGAIKPTGKPVGWASSTTT